MIQRREQPTSRSVGLLIGMLMRFPEIVSVKYDPRQQTLRLSLLITGGLKETEFDHLKRTLLSSLETYLAMQHRRFSVTEITKEGLGMLMTLSITRDVHSLTPAEAWMIVEFARERFADQLITELSDSPLEDEMLSQSEMIEEILLNLERNRGDRNLIAIREEGRVLVFQK